MALINCPECKTEISDKADKCPKCGFPISKQVEITGKEELLKENPKATIPPFPIILYFISIPIVFIFFLVIPIPSFLLDISLVFNFIFIVGAAILLMSMLGYSTLPPLFFTLAAFRLGLYVITTRLILLKGNEGPDAAGKIIETIGAFFMGFGAWVGFIVFLILMISYFFVHFRAINKTKNSFGSLGGFITFVRIDAIGGICFLTLILLGGFAVGMINSDMTLAVVLKRYVLLMIGSAVAIQLPAIVFSQAIINKLKKLEAREPASQSTISS